MMADEDDKRLGTEDLVRMFEESEEATYEARQLAERDRDYYDNRQLTAAECAALRKRGQPEVIFNRIKDKVDFLVGFEKQQGIDPRALPRTPVHEEDANSASGALRYVADDQRYDHKRSKAWRNLLIEGAAGMAVSVEPGYDGPQIVIRRISWDRMFWDPHSSEADYSDAGYLGVVVWMDYDEALIEYPDGKEALDATMAEPGNFTDTYDDKPKWRLWADKKRKRVRICQIWIKRGDEWYFAEYTKGGILKAGVSPYYTDTGESDCELLFQSAFIDRDNNRYGYVRELIGPQDEINKRRSKALHLLNTAQIVYREGSIVNVDKTRREAAKPDGVIRVENTNAPLDEVFRFNTRTDLASGHVDLLQEAKNEIDLKGPNATMLGDKAEGSSAASGKAIIASQQGGVIALGDIMDSLRDLDIRVFRAIWARIRQYWTAEKWIRTTDDERNVKWVGMNVDPQMVQEYAQRNPEAAQMIAGAVGSVAELDCDIIIDEVPDAVTPALEQFEALVSLKQYDLNNELPFRALVQAAPNLRNKDRIFEEMDQAGQVNPAQQAMQELEVQDKAAGIEETQSKTVLNRAKAMEELSRTDREELRAEQPEQSAA